MLNLNITIKVGMPQKGAEYSLNLDTANILCLYLKWYYKLLLVSKEILYEIFNQLTMPIHHFNHII